MQRRPRNNGLSRTNVGREREAGFGFYAAYGDALFLAPHIATYGTVIPEHMQLEQLN